MSVTNPINNLKVPGFEPVTSDDPLGALPPSVNPEPTTGIGRALKAGSIKCMSQTNIQHRNVQDTTFTPVLNDPLGGTISATSTVQGCFNLENINNTAKTFLGNEALTRQIDDNFNTQVETLQGWVGALGITPENADKAIDALFTLHDMLSRYNTEAFGGFKGIDPAFSTTRGIDGQPLKNAVKKYNNALNVLKTAQKRLSENQDPAKEEELQLAVADAEAKLEKAKQGFETQAKLLKDAAADMLKNLATAGNSEVTALGDGATPRAQFLNEMQKVSLGAWMFNDIGPAFRNAGVITQLSVELSDTEALNTLARQTTMFSEVKAPLTDPAKKQWNEFFGKDGLFPGKPGLRGRSGCDDKDTKTDSACVCNTKGEDDSLINPNKYPELKAFVPKPTARRTAVPQKMCAILNKTEMQEKYGALIKYLEDQKIIKKNETAKLWEPVDSFAAIIDDAGLPTFCSVSGTTGELVCSLVTTADKETQDMLAGKLGTLLSIANNPEAAPADFDISEFVEPIATFMEVGHFHTTAEVLGGFLSVAVALSVEQGAPQPSAEDMQKMFKTLLNYFEEHPQQFLSGAQSVKFPAPVDPAQPPAIRA